MHEMFTQALGLQEPWNVTKVDFDPAAGKIDFDACYSGSRAPCPSCDAQDQPIHDRRQRTWEHLRFFQFRAFVHAAVPRVTCSQCDKVSQVPVPWARPGIGFTQQFEAFVVALCQSMPVLAVAQLLEVSDDRIWRILDHYVPEARKKEDFSTVEAIGVDETASRRGQVYITLVYDTAPHDGSATRLLFATDGRDQTTLSAFSRDLVEHNGDPSNIRTISMDMSAAYQAGARNHFPDAEICFDPFHVVQLFNQAVDEVRRQEVKQHPELKRSRWGTLKAPSKWNRKQIDLMHWLQRSGLKTARAYRIKERARELFQLSYEDAKQALPRIISWCRRCRLPPFKRLGATLRQHSDGILAALEHRRHNGAVESLNGQIQAAKARARGYGTSRHLILIAYLQAARLQHLPSNPFHAAAA